MDDHGTDLSCLYIVLLFETMQQVVQMLQISRCLYSVVDVVLDPAVFLHFLACFGFGFDVRSIWGGWNEDYEVLYILL